MTEKNRKDVFTFAEQVNGKLSNVSLELIGKAKDLAKTLDSQVSALLLAENSSAMQKELLAYGADRVIFIDDPIL